MKNILVFLILFGALNLSCQNSVNENKIFVCPPCNSSCDDLEFEKAGTCNHCGMKLITKDKLKKTATTPKMKIAFYLQPGVEVLDFAGPMEVFSYAGFKVFTVSKTTQPIISQSILKIIPDYSIENSPKADILAFFGGNAQNGFKDKSVIDWIKNQKEIKYHFSVCTGAFALGEAGILKGKTATTFHRSLDYLEEKYQDTKVVRNVRFVDNGKVITTAGISAGIDGALHLVAKLKGLDKAKEIAKNMEYDKWVPGEGLILSADNPYLELVDQKN